jgi:hypothetical protein
MDSYLYTNRQRPRSTLYLDISYLLGGEADWGRAVVITYLSFIMSRDINRVRRYLERHYEIRTKDLLSIGLTSEDFLINTPNELSPRDIVNDSHDLAPRQDIMVDKIEGEPERRRMVTFRVTVLEEYYFETLVKGEPRGYWRTSENSYLLRMLPWLARIDA